MTATGGRDRGEEFLAAVRAGDVERVHRLLNTHPSLARARDAQGTSAILLAAYHRHPRVVEALRATGLALDIHEAATVGDLGRTKDLLGRGAAEVDAYGADGFTPLHLAAHFGHGAVVDLLLGRGADPNAISRNPMRFTALTGAIASGHRDIAARLIAHGADVNYVYEEGLTPLGEAAAGGRLELVELLLAHGARVDVRTAKGETPLALAQRGGHGAVAEALRRHGARA